MCLFCLRGILDLFNLGIDHLYEEAAFSSYSGSTIVCGIFEVRCTIVAVTFSSDNMSFSEEVILASDLSDEECFYIDSHDINMAVLKKGTILSP